MILRAQKQRKRSPKCTLVPKPMLALKELSSNLSVSKTYLKHHVHRRQSPGLEQGGKVRSDIGAWIPTRQCFQCIYYKTPYKKAVGICFYPSFSLGKTWGKKLKSLLKNKDEIDIFRQAGEFKPTKSSVEDI